MCVLLTCSTPRSLSHEQCSVGTGTVTACLRTVFPGGPCHSRAASTTQKRTVKLETGCHSRFPNSMARASEKTRSTTLAEESKSCFSTTLILFFITDASDH